MRVQCKLIAVVNFGVIGFEMVWNKWELAWATSCWFQTIQNVFQIFWKITLQIKIQFKRNFSKLSKRATKFCIYNVRHRRLHAQNIIFVKNSNTTESKLFIIGRLELIAAENFPFTFWLFAFSLFCWKLWLYGLYLWQFAFYLLTISIKGTSILISSESNLPRLYHFLVGFWKSKTSCETFKSIIF